MAKRTTKSENGKQTVLTAKDRVFVGLDVHKKSYHAAVRINGREVTTRVLAPTAGAVLVFLEPYRSGRLHVVYEAGPTGFGLVRALREAKVSADVIAPSKTPQTPGEENKTDRPDCRPLAFYDEKGMLKTSGRPDGRGGGRPPSDTAAGPGGGRQAARQAANQVVLAAAWRGGADGLGALLEGIGGEVAAVAARAAAGAGSSGVKDKRPPTQQPK